MQGCPGPVRPRVLLNAATNLPDPVHVGDEFRRPGPDSRRVPVREREQLQGLPHRTVPGRPTGALRPFPVPPTRGLLDALQERGLSGGAHGLGPRRYLPDRPAALLEVSGKRESGLEDGLPQFLEFPFLRVP
jgi:hypothetical protein